jgi:hypothetical protein
MRVAASESAGFRSPWRVTGVREYVHRGVTAMSQSNVKQAEVNRETIEFDGLPTQFNDPSSKETVDDKLVIELIGQLLLTASRSHRAFLEQQEHLVVELMQQIPANPRLVEAELAKVYQQIKASFIRLVEAIGDHSPP